MNGIDMNMSDAEKKGVRIGSLINAVLGTVATGNPMAGLGAGTMTYNAGSESLMGDKQRQLDASKIQELIDSSVASRGIQSEQHEMAKSKPWHFGQVGAGDGQVQTASFGPEGVQTYGEPMPQFNPATGKTGGGAGTSLMQNIEYLQKIGLAENPAEAYKLAQQSRTMTREDFLLGTYQRLQNAMFPVSEEQIARTMKNAETYYDSVNPSAAGGTGGASVPGLDQWLPAAQKANPNVSEQDLIKYYKSEYGGQ